MTIIEPIKISIISTNAVDEALPTYNASTSYSVGAEVKDDDFIYVATKDGTISNFNDGFAKKGYLNSKRVLDEFINTKTEAPKSLTLKIKVSDRIDTLSFFALEGHTLKVKNETIDKTISLKNTSFIGNWLEYFFWAPSSRADISVSLPLTRTGEFDVEIISDTDAKVGLIVAGAKQYLGATLYGVKTSILDFSKKQRDEFGNVFLKKGNSAKSIDCELIIPTPKLDIVQKKLESIAGKPCLYLADDRDKAFESLQVYGYYEDFDLLVSNPISSECNINIKGLI